MIDLVSTRDGVDHQTAACARLLTAVIAQAIRDACKPVSKEEEKKCMNMDLDARAAIKFLFGDESVFPLYASLIGSSAESIRKALTEPKRGDHGLTEMDRRFLSARKRWAR